MPRMHHQQCFACGKRNNKRENVSRKDRIILHRFPKDKKSVERWKKFCSLIIPLSEKDDFRNVSICSKHFEISAYNNEESHLLKRGAYPTIYKGRTYVLDDDSSDDLPPAGDLDPSTELPAPSDLANNLDTQIGSTKDQVPSTDLANNLDSQIECTEEQGLSTDLANNLDTRIGSTEDQVPSTTDYKEDPNNESKCRICFCQKPVKARKKIMDSFYKNYPTIRDMLSLCVPQLEHPILSNDWVCLECLEELCSCVKFVEKCMQTDKMIGLDKALFDHDYTFLPNSVEVYIKEEEYEDVPDNDDLRQSTTSATTPDVLPQGETVVENNVDISNTDNLSIPQSDSHITDGDVKEQKADKSLYNLNKVETCDKCGRVFYSYIMFRRHVNEFRELDDCMFVCRTCSEHYLEVHNCGKPGTACNYCFKVFDDKETYNEHTKTHTPFSCETCTSSFSTQSQVNLHMLTHQMDLFEQCTGCENIYTKDKINNHLLKIHNPVTELACEVSETSNNSNSSKVKRIRKFKCPLCPEVFRTISQRARHVKYSERHLKKFPCKICDKVFEKYASFKEHLKSDHDYAIFCDKCLAKFDNEEDLKTHLKTYAAKTFPCGFSVCEKCDMRFWKTKNYEAHLKLMDCKYRWCEVCNKKFFTNLSFSRHKHTVKKTKKSQTKKHSPRIYVCEKCGKSFNSSSRLRIHQRSRYHTSEENLVMCENCGKSFSPMYYKKHIREVHTDLPNDYLCIYCSKQFKKRRDLHKHETGHTRIKVAPCIECDKKFFNKSDVENHYRAVHLKLRPYECTECGSDFRYKSHRSKHMKMHEIARLKKKTISDQEVVRLEPKNSAKKTKKRKLKNRELSGLIKPRSIPGCFVKCHFCDQIIKKVEGLKLHIRNRHAKIRRYKCDLCEMTFIFRVSLEKHAKQHKDPRYKYRCKICFKILKSQEEFIQHSAKHKLMFECDICSQRFGRKYLLECHKESVHPNPAEKAAKYREMVEIAYKNIVFVRYDEEQ